MVDYTCNWVTAVWHSWSSLPGTNHIHRPSLSDKTDSWYFYNSVFLFRAAQYHTILNGCGCNCTSPGATRYPSNHNLCIQMASYTQYFVCEETRCCSGDFFMILVSVHITIIPLVKITCDIAHANSHVIKYIYRLSSNDRALVAHAVSEIICQAFKRHRSESWLDLSIWM